MGDEKFEELSPGNEVQSEAANPAPTDRERFEKFKAELDKQSGLALQMGRLISVILRYERDKTEEELSREGDDSFYALCKKQWDWYVEIAEIAATAEGRPTAASRLAERYAKRCSSPAEEIGEQMLPAEKENWPECGIEFPYEGLGGDDVNRIVAHVEALSSDKSKLKWIDMLFIECAYRDIYRGPASYEKRGAADLLERCCKLKERILRIAKLELKIEIDELDELIEAFKPESQPAEEIEDEPATPDEPGDELNANARQQTLAAFYLLRALDVQFDVHGKKKPIKEFIAFLIGNHFKTVERALTAIAEGDVRPEDRELILPLFKNAQLMWIVEKIEKECQRE